MKVIFIKDQMPTAIAGDVLTVKDGFARNFLLPRQIATVATPAELEAKKKLQEQAIKRREMMTADWQNAVDDVKSKEIKLTALCSPTGRLYGSVTSAQIAAKLAEITGAEVTRRQISLEQPIKMTGNHTFTWMAYKGVSAKLRLIVEGDQSEEVEFVPPAEDSSADESGEGSEGGDVAAELDTLSAAEDSAAVEADAAPATPPTTKSKVKASSKRKAKAKASAEAAAAEAPAEAPADEPATETAEPPTEAAAAEESTETPAEEPAEASTESPADEAPEASPADEQAEPEK